jgi:hypothetical protein
MSVVNTAMLLKTIASLESQLHELTSAITGGGEIAMSTPVKKAKKEKDPDAPKKEANVWIKFTQRVGTLLKAAAAVEGADPEHFKGPATMVKEFCSMLKTQKPYEAWSDSEVLEAFESWERPVHEPRAKKSATNSIASDSGSVTDAPSKKEAKKRAPRTEEQKAATAAKRAATLAAKKATEPVAEAAEVIVAPEPVAAPAPVAKKAPAVKKAVTPKTYTLEQLTNFESLSIEGEDFGVNERGDVIDSDGAFIGVYDSVKKSINRSAKAPSDWADVTAAQE